MEPEKEPYIPKPLPNARFRAESCIPRSFEYISCSWPIFIR